MSTFDVSDLPLPVLIQALWSHAISVGPLARIGLATPQPPSIETVTQDMARMSTDLDYYRAVAIKTNFRDMTRVNPCLYDRDAGDGCEQITFGKIVKTHAQANKHISVYMSSRII